MKLHLKKSGAKSLLAAQAALALALVSLPSCSGGGGESGDDVIVRDISPHALVPEGTTLTEVRIRGIHLANTGWEMGSDNEDDVPQDGVSVERQLTMFFRWDGTMDLQIPYASVPDNPEFYGVPDPRQIDLVGGTWWQEKVSKQHNTVMYINFRITGTIDPNGAPCIYTGENICLMLRERQMDPAGGWRFDGSVMSGTLRMKADRTSFSGWGTVSGDSVPQIYESVKNLWDQPCTYIVNGAWEPDDAQ